MSLPAEHLLAGATNGHVIMANGNGAIHHAAARPTILAQNGQATAATAGKQQQIIILQQPGSNGQAAVQPQPVYINSTDTSAYHLGAAAVSPVATASSFEASPPTPPSAKGGKVVKMGKGKKRKKMVLNEDGTYSVITPGKRPR